MNPREFAIEVVRQLTDAGYLAYWAGGCVRDLLLEKEPQDFDVATTATPEQVRELFGKRRTLAVGASFGVIIVLGPKTAGQVEVATFRKEGEYLDGRRPESVSFSSPQEDAQRRDFTINGMFFDPLREEVHDFVGGRDDLQRRLIRSIGDAHDRVSEDKLRLLRAVRFASVLGFRIEAETAAAVQQMASQLVVVSAERITQELKKMLVDLNRATAMRLCEELGLLGVIFPEIVTHTLHESLEHWERILELLQQLRRTTFEIAMAALLRDVPAAPERHQSREATGHVLSICRRLKLSNQETQKIHWLTSHRQQMSQFPQLDLAQKKRFLVEPHFADLFLLERTAAVVEQRSLTPFEAVDAFLARTPEEAICPPEILNGRLLIQQGYQPGPHFSEWLRRVRDAQLREEITTQEEALRLVDELAAEQRDSHE